MIVLGQITRFARTIRSSDLESSEDCATPVYQYDQVNLPTANSHTHHTPLDTPRPNTPSPNTPSLIHPEPVYPHRYINWLWVCNMVGVLIVTIECTGVPFVFAIANI